MLGFLQRALEGTVELVQDLGPADVTLRDLVELLLQVGREVHVDDVWEMLDQFVGDDDADILGVEPLLLKPHVASILDRGDDRGVGGRSPDTQLLQSLDQRGLRVTGRRLREVLLGQNLEHPEQLFGTELGQRRLGVLVGPLVASLLVHADEAVENEGLTGGAQAVATLRGGSRDVYPHLIEARLGHLCGHRSLPYHRVKTKLVAIQSGRHTRGCALHAGRADGLVSLLRVARFRLVAPRLIQGVVLAVLRQHELSDLAQRRLSDVD